MAFIYDFFLFGCMEYFIVNENWRPDQLLFLIDPYNLHVSLILEHLVQY